MSENKFYELMEVRGLGFLPKMNMVIELYKEDGKLDKRGWIKGVNHSLNLKVKFMGEKRDSVVHPTWNLVYRDEEENAIADFRSEI